jgi:hypothetical protein
VDQDTLFGPFFLTASFLLMLPATALGLQAGYPRFSPLDLPQGLPVLTSIHCSPNHLPRPPLAITYTTLLSLPRQPPPLDLYHLAAQALA